MHSPSGVPSPLSAPRARPLPKRKLGPIKHSVPTSPTPTPGDCHLLPVLIHRRLQVPQMSGLTRDLSFCDWLTSLTETS